MNYGLSQYALFCITLYNVECYQSVKREALLHNVVFTEVFSTSLFALDRARTMREKLREMLKFLEFSKFQIILKLLQGCPSCWNEFPELVEPVVRTLSDRFLLYLKQQGAVLGITFYKRFCVPGIGFFSVLFLPQFLIVCSPLLYALPRACQVYQINKINFWILIARIGSLNLIIYAVII